MKAIRFVSFLLALPAVFLAAAATAGHGERTVQVYKFGERDGELTTIRLDSEIMGFHVNELADDESRVVTTEDGQVVTLTRNGDSLNIAVDGQSHDVPLMPADLPHGDHGMRIVKKMIHPGEGLTILSDEPLDEATQETIRGALSAAGIDKEVNFGSHDVDIDIDASHDVHGWQGMDGHKRIVIRKSPD